MKLHFLFNAKIRSSFVSSFNGSTKVWKVLGSTLLLFAGLFLNFLRYHRCQESVDIPWPCGDLDGWVKNIALRLFNQVNIIKKDFAYTQIVNCCTVRL